MPFPRKLLTEDEDVVVELRPHWAFLGWPLIAAVAVVVLAIAVEASFSPPSAVLYLLLVLVAGSALWLAARLVRWFATNLVVTTTRIVQRSGVLSRNGFELRLERINQLSYHQTLVGRIFRTGELLVEMGGETGVVVFDHVPRPAAVQSVITEQINAVHRRPSTQPDSEWDHSPWDQDAPTNAMSEQTPPSGTPRVGRFGGSQRTTERFIGGPPTTGRFGGEPTVADRLVQLDELRRRGILTDAEFAAKKAELLDRL
jgi:hypothetical protein